MTPAQRPTMGAAMVVASGALFAVNGTVAKLVLRTGMDAPQLTTLRASGAFVGLLLLLLCLVLRPHRLKVHRRELGLLVGFGLTGFLLVPMLYFVAIGRLPVGIGLRFEYTAPLLVTLWVTLAETARCGPRRARGDRTR